MRFLFSLLAGDGLVTAYTVTAVKRFMDKNIDPIVHPGQYDKAHLHTFFGSDAVTINTKTSAELQAGCTTAYNPNDLSVYWVATLLYTTNNGDTYKPVDIARFSAYYENIGEAEIPIPQNLKLVAGNMSAATEAQMDKSAGIAWFCEGDQPKEKKNDKSTFPTETCSNHLQMLLYFQDCVEEKTLDVAYSSASFKTKNFCPQGFKRMPRLRFSIRYDLRKNLPNGWQKSPPLILACGNSYCAHGDFINGWLQEAAVNMLAAKDKREFMFVAGPKANKGGYANCKAKDADPGHGTSSYQDSVKVMNMMKND